MATLGRALMPDSPQVERSRLRQATQGRSVAAGARVAAALVVVAALLTGAPGEGTTATVVLLAAEGGARDAPSIRRSPDPTCTDARGRTS